jgi:hypothetical protein
MIMSDVGAKPKSTGITVVFFVILSFVVSFFLYEINNKGTRRVIVFESKTNPKELSYEVRFLKKPLNKDAVNQYVDELLLGPISPQGRLLFPLGTKVRSCFVEGNVLYLDLSEDALQIFPTEASDSVTAIKILKKNLFTNFKNVDIINVFIMGNRVEA